MMAAILAEPRGHLNKDKQLIVGLKSQAGERSRGINQLFLFCLLTEHLCPDLIQRN